MMGRVMDALGTSFLNPADSTERQRDKLVEICSALMRRVQQAPDENATAYVQFERAALLEAQVRTRTADLERALDLLNDSNAQLAEANREIETARSNLDEALESMDDGFALFDQDERLLLFNSRFCNALPDVKSALHHDMAFGHFVELVSQSRFLDLPETMKPRDWPHQRLRRHQNQRVVFNVALENDRWMQVGEHRTEQGGTVVLQTDVTDIMRDQRHEREVLVDSQARMLRATLDHLQQGVCIFDDRGRLVGWNHKLERMMQDSAPRVRVRMDFDRLLDLFYDRMEFGPDHPGTSGNQWLRSWAAQGRNRQPITFELTDENGLIYSVFAQEMPDHGFVISLTDVTIQHRAAKELRDINRTLEQRVANRTKELGTALAEAERANETKSRFVAAASHDLLQPLSAAKLFAESLLDEGNETEARATSHKVISALTSVEEIIEALLDISKLDIGQATFNIQNVALRDVFASLALELSPAAQAKGLRLSFVDTSAHVVSDPVFLRRIVQNLVSNAVRYTDRGAILVGARRDGSDGIRIEVHDTGPGIAPDDQQKIFKEFARLSPSQSGATGLGLGLAIVDRACRSLGHPLSLRSTVGRGSCFSVGVERSQVAEPVLGQPAPDLHGQSPLAGKFLMVVENDARLARAVEMRLQSWGAHVIAAASGAEALDLLSEIELIPDALVLDFQLGDAMTGLELYCLIKDRYGPVPGMVISANRSRELGNACDILELPLLSKPLDPARLVRTLQALTSGS